MQRRDKAKGKRKRCGLQLFRIGKPVRRTAGTLSLIHISPYDWISRDKEVVARYAQDAKCTFIFTASAFHELMAILRAVNRPQWAQKVDKRLPVALFAGDADPVLSLIHI